MVYNGARQISVDRARSAVLLTHIWQSAAEKLPFVNAAEKEKKQYKKAMEHYVPPPKIWISGKPTVEQERLYAKPLAVWRLRKKRRLERLRAAAKARAEEKVCDLSWYLINCTVTGIPCRSTKKWQRMRSCSALRKKKHRHAKPSMWPS